MMSENVSALLLVLANAAGIGYALFDSQRLPEKIRKLAPDLCQTRYGLMARDSQTREHGDAQAGASRKS